MNKQELIIYLDAVCDAESAVQACEDAIYVYRNQQQVLRAPTPPQMPIHYTPRKTNVEESDAYGKGAQILSFLVLFIILLLILNQVDGMQAYASVLWSAIGAGLASLFIGDAIQNHMNTRASNAKYEHDKENAAMANAEEDINYAKQMEVYQEQTNVHKQIISVFDSIITNQTSKLEQLRKKREILYGRNILYPSFRNLIAAYQIREYLQMGICDTLEGPTGAYAQYMNDVRTARICDSITALKRSLITAIHGLQGTLARELQQIDSNLDSLRSDMNTSVQRLNAQMQQLHNASTAQLDAQFNEANRQLSAISNTLAVSEHNRYIERRLNNVDTYLMKLP